MRKCEIIKKNYEFNDIINTGACLKNKYYNIYYKDNDFNIPKFGLAVSKKCGNAVERNKLKRQIRSIVDNHKYLFQNNDYIIMTKKSINDINYAQMENYFISLFKERK